MFFAHAVQKLFSKKDVEKEINWKFTKLFDVKNKKFDDIISNYFGGSFHEWTHIGFYVNEFDKYYIKIFVRGYTRKYSPYFVHINITSDLITYMQHRITLLKLNNYINWLYLSYILII